MAHIYAAPINTTAKKIPKGTNTERYSLFFLVKKITLFLLFYHENPAAVNIFFHKSACTNLVYLSEVRSKILYNERPKGVLPT
jgi:hypothetical protein